MDARTAEALEASILHWQENVAAKQVGDAKIFNEDCALCALFYVGDEKHGECFGCPVRARSRRKECGNTPWSGACNAWWKWEDEPRSEFRRDAFTAAAKLELAFLISLRDPVEATAKATAS